MSSYVAMITTRTNRQIIKYRGKWLHWKKEGVRLEWYSKKREWKNESSRTTHMTSLKILMV